MKPESPAIVVAGHVCVDVIPTFGPTGAGSKLLAPGTLTQTGPMLLSNGGCVSNCGLALHRLGVPVRLMGKISDDWIDDALRRIIDSHGPGLSSGMIVARGARSSYTLVISPPGVDRSFLHYPGPNDTFGADDVPYDQLRGARIFHFGYPPLMRRIYSDGGVELERMFRRVKSLGVVTSLDMAYPDPASDCGRVDWRSYLRRVLPQVDIFLPSFEEIRFMLDPQGQRFGFKGSPPASGSAPQFDGELLAALTEELLSDGAAVVGLKLGEHGLYVRTTGDVRRLEALRPVWTGASGDGVSAAERFVTWARRELLSPCFEVCVVSTTGSGDCTIAGFLTGMHHGLSLEATMTGAVAVGACNVEHAETVGGIPSWETVQARIRAGWPRHPAVALGWRGWRWETSRSVAVGPQDSSGK